MTAICSAAGEPCAEQRGRRWGQRGCVPPGSRRISDPKRDRGWFLLVSPCQHQVRASLLGTTLAAFGASPLPPLKSPGGHMLSSRLHLLQARCPWQSSPSRKLFPSTCFICRGKRAKAVEMISFVRSGDPSLDAAGRWQEVTHAGCWWHWRRKVALEFHQLVQLMCSPVGLRWQLVCVNVCPAVAYSMINMLMYDPGISSANEPHQCASEAASGGWCWELVVSLADAAGD